MKVTLVYDPAWTALEWAKKHCPSYVTNAMHTSGNLYDNRRIDYFFSDNSDAVLFKLTWA